LKSKLAQHPVNAVWLDGDVEHMERINQLRMSRMHNDYT
jgi:hypothetical protein